MNMDIERRTAEAACMTSAVVSLHLKGSTLTSMMIQYGAIPRFHVIPQTY